MRDTRAHVYRDAIRWVTASIDRVIDDHRRSSMAALLIEFDRVDDGQECSAFSQMFRRKSELKAREKKRVRGNEREGERE